MKICPKCGARPLAFYGSNYCTKCGALLKEIAKDTLRCSNPACPMCIDQREFVKSQKYCGECGFKLIFMEKFI